jgi:saccharopine dehydrogenase-like NADP-dependent oxidoreductase
VPEEVHVSAAGRDLDPPAGFSVPYALRTLIDELTMRPVVIRDGQPVEIEPLSPGGEVDFDDPVGRAATIHTLHSELLTFPASFGCREASFRLSLEPDLLDRLRRLAGGQNEAVMAAAREALPPSPHTVSVHLIEAAGGGRRVRLIATTRPAAGWGLGGGVVSTGAPAAAALRLLARGRVSARGALPPERCLDPDDLFPELERRGCEFRLEVDEADDRKPRSKSELVTP